MKHRATYDRKADAVYVVLSSKPYARGENLDDARRVDYAEDGTPIGVELLYVSQGVDLTDLPNSKGIEKAIAGYHLPILA